MPTLEQVQTFSDYFIVELANTTKIKQDCYALRYRTFVEEFGFEDKANYKEPVETDDYDFLSTSIAIYHRSTGNIAACIRVIPGYIFDQLPVERYIKSSLDMDKASPILNDRNTLAEISRVAVDKNFRRRKNEHHSPIGTHSEEERSYPLIAVACFLASDIVCEALGIYNGIAVMEPFLPQLTGRSGIHFEPIGEEVDYHGKRIPYVVNHVSILDGLSPALSEMRRYIKLDMINQLMHIY